MPPRRTLRTLHASRNRSVQQKLAAARESETKQNFARVHEDSRLQHEAELNKLRSHYALIAQVQQRREKAKADFEAELAAKLAARRSTPPSMTACGAHAGKLHKGSAVEVCLLAAASISSRELHVPVLLSGLSALCERHAWVHARLNLFDVEPQLERVSLEAGRHPHIGVTTVPGFKTLFWKLELHRELYVKYTHVWLVDSDMAIAPNEFDLPLLLRVMYRINASIVQPSPYGSGRGFFGYTGIRGHNRFEHVCGKPTDTHAKPGPWWGRRPMTIDERCVACRTPVVEVKVPLFTRQAWDVIYSRVLSQIKNSILKSDVGLDLVWCSVVEKAIGSGCVYRQASLAYYQELQANKDDPPCRTCNATSSFSKRCKTQRGVDAPHCSITPQCGSTCAVVYATPVLHRDMGSIAAVLRARNATYEEQGPYANSSSSFDFVGAQNGSTSSTRLVRVYPNRTAADGGEERFAGHHHPIGTGGEFYYKAIFEKVKRLVGMQHINFPSWRPVYTLMRAQPCWSSKSAPLKQALSESKWSPWAARELRLRLLVGEAAARPTATPAFKGLARVLANLSEGVARG